MAQTLEARILLSAMDKTAGAFRSAASNAQRFGTAMATVGRRMTLAVTLPLLALAKSSLQAAVDFESAMADVRKVVDFPTPESFIALGTSLREMSLRMPLAATELAAIAAAAGQAGIPMAELGKFTEMVTKAAVAFELSPADAGSALAKIKSALALTIPETELLTDAMNTLANNMATSEADVLEVVRRVAALGKISGVAPKHVAALGAAMSAAGVDSEKASTAIRNIFLEMQAGTNASVGQRKAWKKLGLDAVTMSKRIQEEGIGAIVEVFELIQKQAPETRAAILTALFDKRAVDAAGPLLNNIGLLKLAMKLVADDATYAGSATREFAIRQQTAANKLKLFKNAATNLGIVLGNEMLPTLTDLATKTAAFVNELAKASPETFKFTLKALLMVAALGPVIWVLGKLATAAGKAAKAMAWLTGLNFANIGKGLARFSWRMGLVGLAATAAAGVVWWAWNPVKGLFTGTARAISEKVAPALKGLQPVIDAMEPHWTKLKGWMSGALTPPGAETRKSWDEWAYTTTKTIIDAAGVAATDFANLPGQMFDTKNWVKLAKTTADQVAAVWNDPGLWKGLDDAAAAAGNAINSTLVAAWQEVIDLTEKFKAFWKWLGTVKWPELRAPEWWKKLFGDKAGQTEAAKAASKFTLPPGIAIPPRPQSVMASGKSDMLFIPPQKVDIGDGEVTLRIRIDGPGVVTGSGIRQPEHLKVRLGIDNAGRLIGGI